MKTHSVLGTFAIVLSSTLICLGGCSSSSSSEEGMSAKEFGARYCALLEPCCLESGFTSDMNACNAMLGAIPPSDGAAAEECLAVYEQRAQEADWCETVLTETPPPACDKAFPQSEPTGTKPPGGSCSEEADCATSDAGDVVCANVNGASICQLRRHAGVGEACIGTVDGNMLSYSGELDEDIDVCLRQEGLYCEDSVCKALASASEACAWSEGCLDGLYCADGLCAPKVGEGSSCASSSDACDDATYCDFDSSTCLAKRPDGSSCTDWSQCQAGYCNSSGVCERFNPGDIGLAFFCM